MSKKSKYVKKLECTNCSAFNVPLLACGKCMLVHYCSRNCQMYHWTTGKHSKQCFPVEDRKPVKHSKQCFPVEVPVGAEKEMCVICLYAIETKMCVLPCYHKFHAECVDDLRTHGVSLNCPLCRTGLPDTRGNHLVCKRRYYEIALAKLKGEMVNYSSLLKDWTVVATQGHQEAQFMVGVLNIKSNNMDVAESWFIKLENLSMALYNRGFIKSSHGDVEGAIELFERAIKSDPENTIAYFGLGNCMLKLNKLRDAEKFFRDVIRMDPYNADGFYNLGYTMWHMSYMSPAVAFYMRALYLNPGDKEASGILKGLEYVVMVLKRTFMKIAFMRWRCFKFVAVFDLVKLLNRMLIKITFLKWCRF